MWPAVRSYPRHHLEKRRQKVRQNRMLADSTLKKIFFPHFIFLHPAPTNCHFTILPSIPKLYLHSNNSGLFVMFSAHSTVWRKQKSGLEYWGYAWSSKTQRVRCPHTMFESGDFSLQIDNVKEEDGGVYSCRVERGVQVIEKTVTLRITRGKKHGETKTFSPLHEFVKSVLKIGINN